MLDKRLIVGDQGAVAEKQPVPLQSCPVCEGQNFSARYRIGDVRIETCLECGLSFQNPQPSDEQLNEIYGPNYFLFSEDDPLGARQFETVKRATARLQLAELAAYLRKSGREPQGLRLLEIGCGYGNLLLEAKNLGFSVRGLDYSAHAAATANHKLGSEVVRAAPTPTGLFPANSFDVCVLADVIEHVRDPRRFLSDLLPLLDKNGIIFIATPDLNSLSAKLLGPRWVEYKLEHLYYFNAESISRLLRNIGFTAIETSGNHKVLTPDYIISHFERYPMPGLVGIMGLTRRIIPAALLRKNIKVSVGSFSVFATKPS
jgi:2-polyprenyl-3-methyl-5-hydroxy-6-metoxy-1,4-benzoquinol methylase/Zn ribbon nucleic-acid-binding protein